MSTNAWVRDRATRYGFVKRSVRRFMPGETVEEAIAAARELQPHGITTILTKLGENLTAVEEAEDVTRHYLDVLDMVAASGLDAQVSIKPTQLGLDLDRGLCERNLDRLIARAEARDNIIWIDMESSPYVDRTLDLFRRARARTSRVGVALQAYLYRTADDLDSLLPLGCAIRIVKGAYLEPPSVAYPNKADVDENFYRLCVKLLAADASGRNARAHRHARCRLDRSASWSRSSSGRCLTRATSSRCSTESNALNSCGWQNSESVCASSSAMVSSGFRGTCDGSPSGPPTSGS